MTDAEARGRPVQPSFVTGLRLGLPYAAVAFVLSLSFGLLATQNVLTPVQAIAMSALVFAGSSQFAALAVMTGGGSAVAAIAAGALMNSRFLAMGIAIAPSLPGRPLARGLQAQTIVDPSWAMASRGNGTFDRWLMFGATVPQYLAWVLGTAVGALGGGIITDPERLGLDAVLPTFFLALLIPELKKPGGAPAAVCAVAIALVLVPVTPPGTPILVASIAALWGWRR